MKHINRLIIESFKYFRDWLIPQSFPIIFWLLKNQPGRTTINLRVVPNITPNIHCGIYFINFKLL